MIATIALIELVGYVILLLWGMHMVQSGVVRAFGSDLRRVIGSALPNRFAAVGAGLVVTTLLQSSTATAMMITSLAADGMVALAPALAVMLGANIGTALIVKVLSFDGSWIAPPLLIAGYVAFRRGRKGMIHDLGRVGIGLGLMLLGLHQLVLTIQPIESAPVLGEILGALTREPLLDLALAALLTWAAHSSVAVMLLLASLAAGNVITPVAAIALVLGANLGGAIPPVLESPSAQPASRRLPIGNLAFRALGCIVALPFAQPIAATLSRLNPDPAASVVNFHIAFNLVLAIVFVGLLGPAAGFLTRALPEQKKKAEEVTQPLYLDEAVLDTPYLALTNASPEVLRMADLVDAMLRRLLQAVTGNDLEAIKDLIRSGKALDRQQEALKAYLTQLGTDGLSVADAQRHGHVLDFAVNLGHAGDIIERSLADTAARKAKRGLVLTKEDETDLRTFHGRVLDDLKLAASTFMTEDARSAQFLLDAKRQLNAMERASGRHHLSRLEGRSPGGLEASTLHLAILRDLRRVNSHVSTIAYDVLGLADPLENQDDAAERVSAA
ncbi:Na/Pi cotransporter family protein (plasmid) [Mesorhizobium sp. AR07]|uniref:Na/Pi cotransporter family protein n=1 Tax=Mesorhizobium sp. AR07 TaxID=2865838 RepID=UPI00215E0E04|nr:Na/Pi cotransporter family protein [Mesorhizobium sp. AR07]UVK49436.1 Na/Pi cotransporter family protein [Mesorhizobium sp. AR07]